MRYERAISIRRDHPSLAGHFPGRPIVPGVVLLQEVVDTLRRSVPAATAVTGLPAVKFSSPLKPDELVTIEVDQESIGQATFCCRVDRRLIASGVIEFTSKVGSVERV